MLNRKEIEYNVMSLVSTWLFDANDVSHLTLILTNDNAETTIDCNNLDEVVSQLSRVLIDNSEKYTMATLVGVVGEKDKKFGELDII